jgi:hypothetical protein
MKALSKANQSLESGFNGRNGDKYSLSKSEYTGNGAAVRPPVIRCSAATG